MSSEKRVHRRAATNVFVQFFQESDGHNTRQQYREGMVKNFSMGGMYIATEHPFPRESIVIVKFRLESRTKPLLPIQLRAVVRWVRQVTNPKGMGIEFLEFEGIDEGDFREWMTSLLG